MISLLFSYIFLLAFQSSAHTEKLEMKVFRCMGEIKENCTLFQANKTYHLVPDDVLNIYMRQERKVQQVLDSGQLNLLSNDELCSMSPAMLMLIPTTHFTTIRVEYISAAIKCWEENLAIVRKLMKSVSQHGDMDWFFITLQDYELPDSVLNIIAEYVIINNNSNLELFIAKKFSILEHLLPSQILSPMSTKLLAQLSSTKFSPWFLNSKAIRIWSFAMVFYEYPLPLSKWNDNLIRRMGKMLVGITPDDFKFLNLSVIKNKSDLLKMNFSILQIRTLYNHFFEKEGPNNIECKSLEFLQVKLLPEQIQQCLSVTFDFSRIEMPKSINSIFSAKQIVLHHMKKANFSESQLNEDNLLFINKFVFALSPEILYNSLKKSSLTLASLIQLQSPLLTEMQTYYMSAKGSALILSSPLIYNCYEVLQVISAAQMTEVTIPSNIYYHLLSHMPASNNLPRSLVLLNKIWTALASETNFRELLHNRDAAKFVDLLPSKYVRNFSESFIKSIYNLKTNYSSAIYHLPEDFLSILFEEASGVLFNKNYKISQYIFVGGLTCEHILTSNTAEFIVLISQYNHYLRDIGKDFPKNLQSCTVRKLYEYMEMKNLLLQQYMSNNFLSHLTESEIEAVGGYVLTSLPIDNLVRSENIVAIVKAIGKCSYSELMIAASKEKLSTITTIFMEVSGIDEESSLFTLGNLTMFLPEYFMEAINIRDFKLMLESGYLDRRVCGNSNERRILANLVKRTFGDIKTWTPHILVTLGDMLLVIADELQFIGDTVLLQAADLIALNYYHLIDWPKPNPFFKVCANGLDSVESELYIQSLQKLVMWLLEGLSMQRDSIEIPKPEEHLYDKAIFQNVSILDVRIETRKVIDTRQDNVIENDTNISDMTKTLSDDVPSQQDETTTATGSTEQNYTNEDDATYNIDSIDDDKTENITYSSLSLQDSNINSSIEMFKDISDSSVSMGIDSFAFTEATDVFSSPYDKENKKVLKHNATDETVSSTQNENEYSSKTADFTQYSTDVYHGDYQSMTEQEPPIKDIIVDRPSFNDTSTLKTDTTYNNLHSLSVEHKGERDGSVTIETLSENLGGSTNFFHVSHDNNTNSNNSYNAFLLTTTTETIIIPQEDLNITTPTSTEFLNGGIHYTFQEKMNSIDIKDLEMSTIRTLQENEIRNFHSKLTFNNFSESQTSSVVLLNNITNNRVLEEVTEPPTETTSNLIFTHKVKKLFKIFTKSKPSVISFMENPTTTSSTEMYGIFQQNNTDSTNTPTHFVDATPNFSETTVKAVTPDTRVTLQETNRLSNSSAESKTSSTELLNNAVNNSQNKVIESTMESTTELFFKNRMKKLFNIFFKPKPKVISSLPESLPITSTTEMNSFFEQDNKNSINIFNFFNASSGDTTLLSETTTKVDRPEHAGVRNINSSLTSFNIKSDRRYVLRRNTSRKITCDQIRIMGNIVEIIVTEEFINMMSETELNNCVDMFGQMDLTRKLQMLIWNRIRKSDYHFLGKLIGAAQVSDIQRLDLNLTKPWILETLHNLGMYGSKQIKLYVANEIAESSVSLNFESAVSMGSIMCHLLPLSKFLSPEIFLQSSKILGKVLTCNPQCLDKMIRIATNEKAFGPIEKWTEADVNTLGVIVAGLSTDELYEMFTNNFKALGKISIKAMECITKHRQQALSFLKKDAIYSLPYSAALVLNQTSFTSLDELQKAVLSKYLSDPSYNDTSPHKSTSVRAEGCLLIIYMFIASFAVLL